MHSPLRMKPRFAWLGFFAAVVSASGTPQIPDSKISAVTVYADRAIVTRSATLDLASGAVEVAFEKLPAALLDQSLQVAGRGTAQVTILDVTARASYVDFTPNERVKALEDELLALGKQRRVFDDRGRALQAQEASLTRIETAFTQPPTKEAPRLSLDESAKLLAFLDEQRTKFATERQSLDTQIEGLAAKQSAAEKKLGELRGAGGRSYKTVVVRLDAAAGGKLDLTLSYAVPGASWRPSYDARVLSAERAVQLGYFGVVRQNTGEDWQDVDLTLSTARPSLGGSPPPLIPWMVEQQEEYALSAFQMSQDSERERRQNAAGAKRKAEGQPAPAAIAEQDKLLDATVARARIDAQATSASFKIAVAATIPSDNSAQKVPITTARLTTAQEYLAIPKQLKAAFLTAKVTNTSEFPLLAGAMNVFLDESFVAASSLGTVMPGEKFDLALGADEGIALKRKLNNRFTEDTGLVTKSKRFTYDVTLTVQNNKKTTEKIVLLDQAPVSRHEKIVVKLLAPEEKEMKPEPDGTLRWTLTLKPGEKRELPLKFSIEHPADLVVVGIE